MATLNEQQQLLVRTNIEINPTIYDGKTLAQWWNEGNPNKIAEYYNTKATPTFYVWRTEVPFSEIMDNLVAADWTAMDNLTVGQDRIWENIKSTGVFKASSEAHRAAIAECWKGTAPKVAVKDRIFTLGTRTATVLEKLLSTGTGSLASPATMGYVGAILWDQINEAMGV